jgi:Holliday junction resolvase RusA-like endonuclease
LINLVIPIPVSVNELWRPVKLKTGKLRLVKTARYTKWKRDAGWIAMQSAVRRPISGRYNLTVLPARCALDLGNVEKAISDLLVELKLIKSDKLAESICSIWINADDPEYPGDGMVRVMVEPVDG